MISSCDKTDRASLRKRRFTKPAGLNALLALALAVAMPAGAGAATITGDPAHSSAGFSVKHLAISTVTGGIPVVSWSGAVTEAFIPTSITATLDVTRIDSKNEKRDADLRGPDWFNVAKNPTITFTSTKIVPGPAGTFKAIGDLTMNGISKSVTLDGKLEGSIVDGRGNKHAGYSATTTVDRRDFGLNWAATAPGGALVAGYDVTLTINAEGIVKP